MPIAATRSTPSPGSLSHSRSRERPIAAGEGQELVVGVVPLADIDRQRSAVAELAGLIAEAVAEPAVRVAVLGHRHPGEAGLPLVEARGGPFDVVGAALEPLQPALERSDPDLAPAPLASARPRGLVPRPDLARVVFASARAGSAVPPGTTGALLHPRRLAKRRKA